MIKKTISVLVLFILLGFLCFSLNPYGHVTVKYSDQDLTSNKVIAKAAKKLSEKYHVDAVGFGGAIDENREMLEIEDFSCIAVFKGKVSFSKRNTEYTTKTAWEEGFDEAKQLVEEKKHRER